jgi:hypothetical protein
MVDDGGRSLILKIRDLTQDGNRGFLGVLTESTL